MTKIGQFKEQTLINICNHLEETIKTWSLKFHEFYYGKNDINRQNITKGQLKMSFGLTLVLIKYKSTGLSGNELKVTANSGPKVQVSVREFGHVRQARPS